MNRFTPNFENSEALTAHLDINFEPDYKQAFSVSTLSFAAFEESILNEIPEPLEAYFDIHHFNSN